MLLTRLHARLGTEGSVALVSAACWLLRYAIRFGFDSGTPHWAKGYDQGRYLVSSAALFHGQLNASLHLYPLLYPLIAAPFMAIDPRDPYLLPDVALFVLVMIAVVRVARRMGFGAVPATTFALLACLVQGKPATAWVEPWTTTLAAAYIWWLIERTLAILQADEGASSSRALLLLGALAAALPLTRPADAIVSAICLSIAAGALIVRRRFTMGVLMTVLAGGCMMVAPYALLHLSIYGAKTSDYMNAMAQAGFVLGDLPWRASVLLVSARPWYPTGRSMIEMMPWLLPAAAGTLLTPIWSRQARQPLFVILSVALPYTIFYLSFCDLHPTGLARYGLVHYFKWEFPLAGLMLCSWLRALASRRGAPWAAVALLAAILPTSIRALPTPVGEDRPARLLLFRGSTNRAWSDAYSARVTLSDKRGMLLNVIGFHQIPDAQGERAIAIKRLFAADATRTDPGESSLFPQPQAPYARYGVRLSIGIPCWIAPAGCAMPPT